MPIKSQGNEFDIKMAKDCADSFAHACKLGCMLTDSSDNVLYSVGLSCRDCQMCEKMVQFNRSGVFFRSAMYFVCGELIESAIMNHNQWLSWWT